MAKLTLLSKPKYLSIVLLTTVLALAFITFMANITPKESTKNENSSIFGRNLFGVDAELGQKADPNYVIQFPKDHGPHLNFDIEWWYLTANLTDVNGNPYGLQWTLFRFRDPSSVNRSANVRSNIRSNVWSNDAWGNQQVYMAHASVHSLDQHWFAEKFARGGLGNAGATSEPFSLFIDDWQWLNTASQQRQRGLLPAELSFSVPLISANEGINAQSENLKLTLSLTQTGPYVKHGDNGYSIKSGNGQHASHYYSAPFIDISGLITINSAAGDSESLTVSGNAWFDQEWTSQLLDTQTQGWDWLSLHLNDGSKIMAFKMRLQGQEDYVTGSFISPTGQLTTLSPDAISLSSLKTMPVKAESSTKHLPLVWQLSIASKNIDLRVESIKTNQWNPALVSYYEGMVKVTGSHTGKGFLELTGY